MMELLGPIVTVVLACVGGIVWLVRLEGRINANKQAVAEVAKDVANLEGRVTTEITTINAKADAEAAAHRETTVALVRVQEQLKYLTGLFEQHLLGGGPKTRTRRPSDQ